MVFAEDIRRTILKLADERGPNQGFQAREVAERMERDGSQGLVEQVWFVASVLVKEGKLRANQYGDSVCFVKSART